MSGTTAPREVSADFGCKGRRRVGRLTRGFELRPVVRVSRLVGFLALGIALVSLQHVNWMPPGTERSPAGPSAVLTLPRGWIPQLAGKWTQDAADVALRQDFAAQAAEVVEGAGFFRSPYGFAARPETTATQEAVEAVEAALSARGGLRLELPAGGKGAARFSLAGGFTAEVREVGAEGEGRQVRSAVAYQRSGGTSYWRATAMGYEEWVLLAAAGEGPVAQWEVKGGQLRQDGDDVLVADASGKPQLRVTAPKAYGAGGEPARAWLRAESNVVALYTTARGRALVDPLWATTGSMTTPRDGHTATLLLSGKVLVVGGVDATGNATKTAELYDPAAGTWSATGSMVGSGRLWHTATLLPSGKVLVAGGRLDFDVTLSDAQLYDPAAGTWSATGSMRAERELHTATLLPSGKVLVAGGNDTITEPTDLFSAELYDPAAGTWSATGSMSAWREAHTATLLPSGKVLVAGGIALTAGEFKTAELYDPAAGTWSATGSMTMDRASHTATLLPSGKVLVAGGFGSSGTPDLGSAELFDPAAETWSATGSMTTVRDYHTATLLTSGEVLVAGGSDDAVPLASAELYGVAGTWSATGSMATVRFDHTATLLPSGKVLVAGGFDGHRLLASAELYDPLATALAITPSSVTVAPGASQTFTASGGSGTGYTWDLSTNNSRGAVTPAGVYTAGATGGVTDVVRVTDSTGGTATATVTVSVATVALAVSPSSVTVAPGASQTFTASGGSGTGYTWDLSTNNSGGAVTPAGVYTAGATGGVTDVVRVTDSANHTATATVTVSMATAALAVSPSRVTVAVGASQTFTASGGSGTGYTWDLATNNSGGAITAAGVYTAGATGGVTDMVRVTDSANHTATATVTVTARSLPSDSNSGCSATGARFPQLAFLVLPLLVSRRRRV